MTVGGERGLVVFRGGVMGRAPAGRGEPTWSATEANTNEREGEGEGEGGPAAGEGERPTAWKGPTSSAAPIISGEGLDLELVGRLEELTKAYPHVRVLSAPPGVWILTRITPIPGLESAWLASLLSPEIVRPPWVRTWAWWDSGVWVGPRHTNYPDGSICAFEEQDESWIQEESLVDLWDLYALWITRHLHLRRIGYWPGEQVLHTAHERLAEQQPQELCAGCRSFRLYGDCHHDRDVAVPPMRRLALAALRGALGLRRVPPGVTDFVWGMRKTPPTPNELEQWSRSIA